MLIPHSRPSLGSKEIRAVSEVIASGKIAQGELVKRFENSIAKFVGMKGGVATSSGTAALHLALLSLGVKKGDEVILPSYLCTAPLNTINYVGAKPVLCDINNYDYNISFEDAKRKITKKTKTIIVPHLFGFPAEIDKFLTLGIPVIEDCAQAIGAKYRNKIVGNFGVISIFSFYATKMLACGEGGMILSNSDKILKIARDLRDYDEKENYLVRYNYKMTDLQAALGLVQLAKLFSFIRRRKEITEKYNLAFQKCNFELPFVAKGQESVFYRYVVKTRGDLEKYLVLLKKRGVVCRHPIYKPLHQYLQLKNFPNTENAWKTALSTPIYPSLTNIEIKKIISAILEVFTS